MKLRLVALSILLIFSFSCKKGNNKTISKIMEEKEISVLDTLSLKLNNGERWIVNEATQIGVTKMDSIIKSFNSNKSDNFIELGNNLSKQTSYIIKNCDMTGEAHDQLHVILVPMLDEIWVLKESKKVEDRRKALNELESLIEAYFAHFMF